MNVQSSAEMYFSEDPATVARAIRSVLQHNSTYVKTSERMPATLFETVVKPHALLLGTVMAVELVQRDGGTHVAVVSQAQRYILGDVADDYQRCVEDFCRDLRLAVLRQNDPSGVASEPTAARA